MGLHGHRIVIGKSVDAQHKLKDQTIQAQSPVRVGEERFCEQRRQHWLFHIWLPLCNSYWNNQHLNLSTTSLLLRSNIGRFWPEITMNPRIYLRNEQNKWEIALCQMFNNTRERVISPMLKSNFSRSSRDKCDSIPQGTS